MAYGCVTHLDRRSARLCGTERLAALTFVLAALLALPGTARAIDNMDYQVAPESAIHPEAALFGPDGTIAGRRIGWHVDDALSAYKEAIATHKPLVIVFGQDWCKFCGDMIAKALTCRKVNALAGAAVFAYSAPSRDKGAMVIANSLGIKGYPSISVLAPDPRMLMELGRAVGTYDDEALAAVLARILSSKGRALAPAAAGGQKIALSRAPVSRCP